MKTKITLEDNGQDFLEFTCDENGIIVETKPFQGSIWNGANIPLDSPELIVGEECPIHNPPHINYGYLKHKVEKIETLND